MSGSGIWSSRRLVASASTAGTNLIFFMTSFVTISFRSVKVEPTTIQISFRPVTSATTASAASSPPSSSARRSRSGSTANSFQKRILTCLLPSQTRSSRGTSEARSGGTKDRGKPRQPGRAREGDSANMHEETIAALQKELQETRQASLDATRRGDFMKVARMTAHSAALNRQLMEAQDKQEAARTGANPRDARK
jgi:hypothetical protein